MNAPELRNLLKEIDASPIHLDFAGDITLHFIESLRFASLQTENCNIADYLTETTLDIDTISLDVETLIENGCLRAAELIMTGIAMMNGSPKACIQKLAEIYELELAYRKTVELALQLLTRYPGEEELIYQLSFALYKLECPDEAIEYLLPLVIQEPSCRIYRLYGLLLQRLGLLSDAIEMLSKALDYDQNDVFSIRALSLIYVDWGMYDKALEIIRSIPNDLTEDEDRLFESLIYRFMGKLDHAISLNELLIKHKPEFTNAYWTLCFSYSISSAEYSIKLLDLTRKFWELSSSLDVPGNSSPLLSSTSNRGKTRLAFLSADIGEHVVSRFLVPILRHYDSSRFFIIIISTAQRFEEKAKVIAGYADEVVSLQGNSKKTSVNRLKDLDADIIIDTSGFTRNSGLPLLATRCALIQCHYIGYHATTGLDTIDYYFGDSITTPDEFQSQFVERLVQIPSLWMAYDAHLQFPDAVSTAQRASPVLGSFSQVSKINSLTLTYWAAAMKACPDSILVIKDRGLHCQTTRLRIETALEEQGVDTNRIYLFGPVSSQLEHLGCYNAIDIALDTTPWSGATTAFEAMGMGVPLVAICGDSTSGRMSTSVVSAAGMSHLISHSIDEFAMCVAKLANNYKEIRNNKAIMQKEVRSGILFDEERISFDFFSTIDRLLSKSSALKCTLSVQWWDSCSEDRPS